MSCLFVIHFLRNGFADFYDYFCINIQVGLGLDRRRFFIHLADNGVPIRMAEQRLPDQLVSISKS